MINQDKLQQLIDSGNDVLGTIYTNKKVIGRYVDETKFNDWQKLCLVFLRNTYGEKSHEYLNFNEECNYHTYSDTTKGLSILKALVEFDNTYCIKNDTFWDIIHPKIRSVSENRYNSKEYADSVEASLKEVNTRVKNVVKTSIGQELDGASLMEKALSLDNPIIKLDDLSTESGRNIQKGYLKIFSGTMTGIRNPKAHENVIIDNVRAQHLITLASLLMYKLDEAGIC